MKSKKMISALSILGILTTASFVQSCGKSGAAKFQGELEGTWSAPCSANRYLSYIFEGSMLTLYTQVFSDAGCTALKSLRVRSEPFTITGESPDVPGAKMVTEATSSTYETPQTQAAADEFNGMSFCGFTDWEPGVPKETSGRTCGGVQIPAVGTTRYNIFKLTDAETLRSGAVSNTTMPTALTATVYTKR